MDTTLERVARAICAAQGLDWDAQADAMTSANGSDNEQNGYRDMARAAVEALKEPSPAMLSAANHITYWDYNGDEEVEHSVTAGIAEDVWQAIIQAILEGK